MAHILDDENEKAYANGYVKGFHDAKTLEEYFVEFGVKIGFLTPEKAEQLLKEHLQIVRCKNCKHRPIKPEDYEASPNGFDLEFPDVSCPCRCDDGWYSWYPADDWFCGNGERKEDG